MTREEKIAVAGLVVVCVVMTLPWRCSKQTSGAVLIWGSPETTATVRVECRPLTLVPTGEAAVVTHGPYATIWTVTNPREKPERIPLPPDTECRVFVTTHAIGTIYWRTELGVKP